MILVCPNCSARFKVKPEALGEQGRAVKCAKCGHQWRAARDDLVEATPSAAAKTAEPPKQATPAEAPPPAPRPEPEPEPAAEPEAPDVGADAGEEDLPPPPPPLMEDEPPETERPPIPPESEFVPRRVVPERKRSPLGAWIALGVFVVLVVVVSFSFRVPIVEAYPPANKVFQMVGFPVDMLGHGLKIRRPKAEAAVENGTRRLTISGEIENETDEAIDVPLLAGSLTNAQGETLKLWTFKAARDEALPGEKIAYRTEVTDPPRGATDIAITFTTEEEAAAAGADMDGGMTPPEDGGKAMDGGGAAQQAN